MITTNFFIFIIIALSSLTNGSQSHPVVICEKNSSRTLIELLKGRDGLPGRDGVRGPPGPPGPQGEKGPAGPKSGGATYTRWGKSTCPDISGTREVYNGIAAGTHFTHSGGGSNYLCMPRVPEYTLPYRNDQHVHKDYIYGIEYEQTFNGNHDHNAPCAVCLVSTRSTVLMIPGKTTCPGNWTREYYGYLMSEKATHKHSSMHECVDRDMETLPGSYANTDGGMFFHNEAVCGVGLPCRPYNNYKELNCVVCSI